MTIHERLFTRWVRMGLLCACGARRPEPFTGALMQCQECGIWLVKLHSHAHRSS